LDGFAELKLTLMPENQNLQNMKTSREGIILLIFISLQVFFSHGLYAQSIVINEVMASNATTIADEDGDYPDWIELYNAGTETVNLEGYGLSDNYNSPFKWIFPDVNIEPGQHLLVWASGKDRRPGQGELAIGLLREVYTGIPGTAVIDLTNHPSYPNNPSSVNVLQDLFEAPINIGDHYGQRIQGWIKAPATGQYVFWISSDDNSQLLLSTSVNPEDAVLIAQVPGWTNPRQWNKYFQQQSAPVTLQEGEYYYIMALMKEHEGGDNLAVGWQQPGGSLERPIPGQHLFTDQTQLHTNFSISAAGEEIILTHLSGNLIDEIPPTAIPTDISYGRAPDGSSDLFFFDEPSPGSQNPDNGYTGIQPPPVFSHEGGPYTESFQLTLEANPNTIIYYTTNGQEPNQGSGILYSSPINISGTVIVRVRAYREGYIPSQPASMIYSRIGSNIQNFKSNLPVVILHQFNTPITPGERTPASAVFIDHNEGDSTYLIGDSALQSRIEANIRGSSAQGFPKKMFGFHLLNEMDGNRDESLFGMPEEHNWILYAPYSDKTLMRNAIAYTLGAGFGRWTPRIRFVELFLHSGNGPVTSTHYHGVYVLVERIKWGEDRVNITKIEPGDNQEPEITGGYIIKKDRLNEGDVGMETDIGTLLAFARPSEADATAAQKNWIRNYMTAFETALYNPGFANPETGYHSYIDVDSFIDHFLITELLKEIDGYRLSTFMYKDRNQKLVMGPVWDFNLSLGNANYLNGWQAQGWYYSLLDPWNCYIGCGVRDWYVRLLQDTVYDQKMKYRWWELRQDLFSNEHLSNMIWDFDDLLSEAQQRNFNRWPILGQYVWPNWFVGQTYQDEINWMHNWLMNRLAWMDSQMGEPPVFPEHELVHFWLFDNNLPNDTPLEQIEATYQIAGNGLIGFHSALSGYPFQPGHPNWRKASMERRNSPTEINYRPEGNNGIPFNQVNMRGLQVKQPFTGDAGENILTFHLPGTGFENLIFSFAAKDENAADYLLIEYSVQPGEPEWIASGLASDTLPLLQSYQLYEIDLSNISEADNNPHFKLRIRFGCSNMSADNGDRVTFNNFSLDGEVLDSLPGDANCDGVVDVIDVIVAVNYIQGTNPQPFCFHNADVNADGLINVMDVVSIVNIIYGEEGLHSLPFD
jgi:hypothetical protein